MSARSGPPRVVVEGANPNQAPYKRCEDEPIHTPGAVQSYGALLGLKYDTIGNLEVRIASENTRKVLGYGPEQLFELQSFLDILKHDFHTEFVARVNHALSDVEATKEETRLDVVGLYLLATFSTQILHKNSNFSPPLRKAWKLEANPGHTIAPDGAHLSLRTRESILQAKIS